MSCRKALALVAGIIGIGIWLRWAVQPVVLAFNAGMYAGRFDAREKAPAGRR